MISALAAAGVVLATGLQARAETMAICVEGDFPPFSYSNAAGEIVGFDIDFAHALCRQLQRDCALEPTEWKGIIDALIDQKCDAIVASMSITEERKKRVAFTRPYYRTPARFVAKEGVDWYDTNTGLKDKTVGVQRGTVHQDYLEALFPDVALKLFPTQDEADEALAAGEVDAVMANSVALENGFLSSEAGEGFAFFGRDHGLKRYHGEGAGIAVRKDDRALRDMLSLAIDEIRLSGEYDRIQRRYFDFDIYGQ